MDLVREYRTKPRVCAPVRPMQRLAQTWITIYASLPSKSASTGRVGWYFTRLNGALRTLPAKPIKPDTRFAEWAPKSASPENQPVELRRNSSSNL